MSHCLRPPTNGMGREKNRNRSTLKDTRRRTGRRGTGRPQRQSHHHSGLHGSSLGVDHSNTQPTADVHRKSSIQPTTVLTRSESLLLTSIWDPHSNPEETTQDLTPAGRSASTRGRVGGPRGRHRCTVAAVTAPGHWAVDWGESVRGGRSTGRGRLLTATGD